MRTLRTAFNGGQISQDAEARSDLANYSRSCRKIKNFIVNVTGSLHKRLGSRYLCPVGSSNVRLIGMSVSDKLSFILEFTHLALRILDGDGNLVKHPGGIAIVMRTPWASSDLDSIQVAHKINAMFVVCANHAPRKIFRSAESQWRVDSINFNWGSASSPWGSATEPGYPVAIAFHENRLWFGGTFAYPQRIWASCTNDYVNMERGVSADDGFDREIASDGLNAITWFKTNRDLIVGTLNEEFLIKSPDKKGLSNTNISILPQTSYGSKRIKPLSIDQSTVFVQGSGDKLREFKYSFADDSFSAKNLSILNPLVDGEISEMVFQKDPDSVIWICTTDGRLMGFTYDQQEQVRAWHEHDVGGRVKSLAVIPDSRTSSDMLFMAIDRDGVTSIEVMTRSSHRSNIGSYYLDSHVSYPNGGLVLIPSSEPGVQNNVFKGIAQYAGKRIVLVSNNEHIGSIIVPTSSAGNTSSIDTSNGRTIRIDRHILYITGSFIPELGVGLQYECEVHTTPIELGEPTRAFTGAKTKLISANFKMSNSFSEFRFGAGDDLTKYGLPDPATANNSYTGDLRLMGSTGEDLSLVVRVKTAMDFGLSQISIVYKITESPI